MRRPADGVNSPELPLPLLLLPRSQRRKEIKKIKSGVSKKVQRRNDSEPNYAFLGNNTRGMGGSNRNAGIFVNRSAATAAAVAAAAAAIIVLIYLPQVSVSSVHRSQ